MKKLFIPLSVVITLTVAFLLYQSGIEKAHEFKEHVEHIQELHEK